MSVARRDRCDADTLLSARHHWRLAHIACWFHKHLLHIGGRAESVAVRDELRRRYGAGAHTLGDLGALGREAGLVDEIGALNVERIDMFPLVNRPVPLASFNPPISAACRSPDRATAHARAGEE